MTDLSGVSLSSGVSSGEARCGNMGCDGMKKYSFVGPSASLVHILERLNIRYGTSALIDGAVEEEARNNFLVRKIDHVLVQRLQERPFRVSELIAAKAVSEDEWMYQLEQGDAGNPYLCFSEAMDLYFKALFDEASAQLAKCTVKDAQHSRLAAMIETAVKSGVKTVAPTELMGV